MIKKKYIILFVIFLGSFLSYGQDGKELILVHNYSNKTAIDNIVNPSDGNIAYNATDKSFYLYDGVNSKWIVDSYYKAITTTSGALTLDESHYTVIIEADTHTITLPTTADYNGREYVLKNTTSGSVIITDYIDNSNTTVTTIPSYNVLKIQSDGTNWHQVNNYAVTSSSSASSTTGTSTGSPIGTTGTDVTTYYASHFYTDSNANDTTNKIDMQYTEPTPLNSDWGFEITNVSYSNITINSVTVGSAITLPNSNIEVTSFEVSPGVYTINIVFRGSEFYLNQWESILVFFDQTSPIGSNNTSNCTCLKVYSL